MLIQLLGAIATGAGGVVTLSGEAIQDTITVGTKVAGIRFNTDGTIDSLIGTTFSQIDASTDWIFPNDFANSTYDVRYTGLTGDAFTTEAAAQNVWIDLGTARQWDLQESGGGIQSNSVTFEIRDDSGTTVGSGAYSFFVDDT